MRVRWLAAARSDVQEIGQWIAKDRPGTAKNVVGRIREAAQRLGQNPGLGRAGIVIDTRELVVPGLPYMIVYRVTEAVEIVWVVDARRDWPARFNLAERLEDETESDSSYRVD